MTSPQHILVVDDEEALRRLLGRILTRAGHTCVTAADGAEARQELTRQDFAIVLCDVNMPGESGIDLARYITAQHPTTAVLMVTGLSSADAAAEARTAGAAGFVTKPFQPNDVLIQIDDAISRHADEINASERRAELEVAVADTTVELERTVAALQTTTDQLRASEQMFRTLSDQSPLGILYSDLDGSCQFVNHRTFELSGRTEEQLLGMGWLDIVHPADFDEVARLVVLAREEACEVDFEHRLERQSDGELRWMHTRIAPLRVSEAPIGFVAVVEDVTERKRHEAELAHLATHDRLTGLPNRALMTDLATAAIAGSQESRNVALLCVGVDRFTVVNETYGHEIGDRLLVALGQRLRGATDPADQIGRLGGDTLVVIHQGSRSDVESTRLAHQILDALGEAVQIDGISVNLSIRIGITIAGGGDDGASVLRDADTALHRAKEGSTPIEFYSRDMRDRITARLTLERDLRNAIDSNELVVHYQPEFDRTGTIVGAEALVRWRHPKRGLVSPLEFIPVAEEAGLIVALGREVLGQACRQAAIWSRPEQLGSSFTMSVNVSPAQLAAPGFVDEVNAALAIAGLAPHHLCLEITESTALIDTANVVEQLAVLRSQGVHVAIDDFGTGFSSLTYLSSLPADYVKIDRSFVDEMLTSVAAARIVEAIVALSHALGLQVVAEGIETHAQHERLNELGCDLFQGFLLGRPVPVLEFNPDQGLVPV